VVEVDPAGVTVYARGVRPRRLAVAVLAAVLAGAGAGCGGDEREDVEAYIARLNMAQQQELVPLTQAAAAYREFSTERAALERLRPRLAEAERVFVRLARRIDALDPPPAARRLHERVGRLSAAQIALSAELHDAATYLLAFDDALAGLGPAQRRFGRELAAAETAEAQAAALDRLAAAVAAAAADVRALDAPPVLQGVDRTQLETLDRIARTARELARGIRRGGDGRDLPPLVQRFANAPLAGSSTAAQRLRIAAVRAYNRRVAEVQELAAEVERERLRLQDTLD